MLPSRSAGSDSADVSETAQALLQAHYSRLAAATDSSDRTRLRKLEHAAANLERTCLQLDNLQVAHELHADQSSAQRASRLLQPLGSLAFWPARLELRDDAVWVRQDVEGLSIADQLAMEDAALPTLTQAAGKDRIVISVRLVQPSRTVEVSYLKAPIKTAQAQLQKRRQAYLVAARELRDRIEGTEAGEKEAREEGLHMVNEADQALNEEGLPFFEPIERVSDEEAAIKKKAYMQPFVRSEDEKAKDRNMRKQWLENTLAKLEQEEEDTADGDEDEGEEPKTADSGSAAKETEEEDTDAAEETRVVLRTRTPSPPPSPEDLAKAKALPEIVSAARPPPVKSALKNLDRPPIVTRPSFGSAGIRHGFLNLNPSSPGAIKSSYSWEDLEREENKSAPAGEQRPSRSHTPTPLSRSSSSATSLLGRVADAASPMTSGTSTPTKKSVRIKSPERAHPDAAARTGLTPLQRALRSSIRVKENYDTPSTAALAAADEGAARRLLDAGSGTAEKRHRDDVGVEEEAERIVQLLGPDVVEGHPNAPPADVLRKMQQAHEEDKRLSTPEAIAAREKHEQEQREQERRQRLAEKPALGQAVMERPKPAPDAQQATTKFSAFKKGFLNTKPTRFVPNAPARVPRPPSESMGISALDRAGLGDDELSERRQAMGLPAAVPHARPSKAYAEKIRLRQQGQDGHGEGDAGAQEENKVALARPVVDGEVPRPGRVRFGPPATQQGDDVDEDAEEVVEINPSVELENHAAEEAGELDEEPEEAKIEGEGADTDEDDYYASYLSQRSRRAAADSRGLDVDEDDDDFDEDAEDWDVDEEDEFDEDDDDYDYDADDLMALAPSMGSEAELGAHPELLREYESARARLAAMGLSMPGSNPAGSSSAVLPSTGSDDEDDYEDDIVPIDATVEDPEYQGNTTTSSASRSRISRFKASLSQPRSAGGPSGGIEELMSSAQNLGPTQPGASVAFGMDGYSGPEAGNGGPTMIIPQLAPVRFPQDGDLVEGGVKGPVALAGAESDDDDDRAEMVMRSRLERQEWKRNHPDEARRERERTKAREALQQGKAPPQVGSRRQAAKDKGEVEADAAPEAKLEEEQQAPKPKKVSRFKAARMGS